MDNDSTQNQNPEIVQLQNQLAKAAAASNFFETETGRLFVELAGIKVNAYTRLLLSDKFDDDHAGFIAAKANLNAYKSLLAMMQKAASPQLRQKLEERLKLANGE